MIIVLFGTFCNYCIIKGQLAIHTYGPDHLLSIISMFSSLYVGIQFTCIHLCYQLTQAVDLCKYRLSPIELDQVLLPELVGNTDV